jgi:hypothetical protein
MRRFFVATGPAAGLCGSFLLMLFQASGADEPWVQIFDQQAVTFSQIDPNPLLNRRQQRSRKPRGRPVRSSKSLPSVPYGSLFHRPRPPIDGYFESGFALKSRPPVLGGPIR